ncbi:MAG: TOBE domain-containing protein, partial [Phycisphaerae bacterium]
ADGIAVLKAGRLEQTGSPADLYRRPVSRFVADFIGESNFLAGTVSAINGPLITIQTTVGQLQSLHQSPQSHPWQTGQKVLAAFRPESITLRPGGVREPNTLDARRISSVYLGELAEHVVALADGQRVKAFELNPQAPSNAVPDASADPISLRIPPEQVMLVPAE